jgi:hypothetical protein
MGDRSARKIFPSTVRFVKNIPLRQGLTGEGIQAAIQAFAAPATRARILIIRG